MFNIALDWPLIQQTFFTFGIFTLGMVFYCVFVFTFYTQISKKFLFPYEAPNVKNSNYPRLVRFWARLAYTFKYLFIAPIALFAWSIIIALILLLLARQLSVSQTLLVSMGLLGTIRICAYYAEHLAEDVAKTLPLSLLALFLIDIDSIKLSVFLERLTQLPDQLMLLAIYFSFIVILEFLLRLVDAIVQRE